MNIIQIQDRLKGMPKEAVIQYVQNPTGDVPTYLALGELERRKTMENKYNAMKSEAPSVAEQIVEENMPMGLASMPTQDMMPPESGVGAPQPQPEPTPDQLTASGIGALPVPEGNFAEGGVVAFDRGGGVLGTVKNFIFGKPASKQIKKPSTTFDTDTRNLPSVLEDVPGTKNILSRNPKKSLILGGAGAYYILNDKGEPEPVSDEEVAAMQIDPAILGGAQNTSNYDDSIPKYNLPTIDDPMAYGKDRMSMYREMIGEDTMTPRLQKRLEDMEGRIQSREDLAPWMAATKAGFAIAAGDSPFALKNIASGAGVGIEDYGQSIKDIEALRNQAFDIDTEILKAKRAEDVAIASKGIDSVEAAEAHNRTMQLEEIKLQEAARERQKDLEVARIGSTVYGYNTGKGILEAEKMIAANKTMQDLEVEKQNLIRPPQTTEKLERLRQIKIEQDKIRSNIYRNLGLTQQPHPDDTVAKTGRSEGWGELTVSE